MDFVLKLVAFIIAFCLIQSGDSIRVSKSIKLNEKMIYDCVDIYKQPSLNHPLLQNHKIQMEPYFSVSKSKEQIERKIYKKIIDCPNDTVPILKNTKEYVANAQNFVEKHFNPFTVESHGTHFAGVRLRHGPYYGIGSWLTVHDLNISGDQASYAHIYVGSRVNNKDNLIQVGWMINPSIFGDGRLWSYGFWKGANGTSCYNTICPGFVQVSKTDPLTEPLGQAPVEIRNIALSIQKDIKSSNWGVLDIEANKPDIPISYWPGELFDLISNGVNIIGVGGAVESSPSGRSPPMGNGHLPTKDAWTQREFIPFSS